ncbi:hypothetical protein T484DRAFT_1892444, partial [Baffinella frigidus]
MPQGPEKLASANALLEASRVTLAAEVRKADALDVEREEAVLMASDLQRVLAVEIEQSEALQAEIAYLHTNALAREAGSFTGNSESRGSDFGLQVSPTLSHGTPSSAKRATRESSPPPSTLPTPTSAAATPAAHTPSGAGGTGLLPSGAAEGATFADPVAAQKEKLAKALVRAAALDVEREEAVMVVAELKRALLAAEGSNLSHKALLAEERLCQEAREALEEARNALVEERRLAEALRAQEDCIRAGLHSLAKMVSHATGGDEEGNSSRKIAPKNSPHAGGDLALVEEVGAGVWRLMQERDRATGEALALAGRGVELEAYQQEMGVLEDLLRRAIRERDHLRSQLEEALEQRDMALGRFAAAQEGGDELLERFRELEATQSPPRNTTRNETVAEEDDARREVMVLQRSQKRFRDALTSVLGSLKVDLQTINVSFSALALDLATPSSSNVDGGLARSASTPSTHNRAGSGSTTPPLRTRAGTATPSP